MYLWGSSKCIVNWAINTFILMHCFLILHANNCNSFSCLFCHCRRSVLYTWNPAKRRTGDTSSASVQGWGQHVWELANITMPDVFHRNGSTMDAGGYNPDHVIHTIEYNINHMIPHEIRWYTQLNITLVTVEYNHDHVMSHELYDHVIYIAKYKSDHLIHTFG